MENLGDLDIFSMMKYITMPGDTTLQMLMTASQYKKLEQYAQDSMHTSLAMFNTMKPMFLLGMQEGAEMASDSADFLDQYFMKKAKAEHKEIIGIESIEEQVKALDLIPLKEQAKMLIDLIEPDTTKSESSIGDVHETGTTPSAWQ